MSTLGIHVSVGATTLYLTLRAPSNRRISWILVAFVVALLICGTVEVGATIKAGIMMFIDNRDFPGGPMAYFITEYSNPVETVGSTAYVLANLLADGVLVSQTSLQFPRRCLICTGLEDFNSAARVRRHLGLM